MACGCCIPQGSWPALDRGVALTFDDGPEQYTPLLLGAECQGQLGCPQLGRAALLVTRSPPSVCACAVQATFFVVGVNVGLYPDIVKR
jgi:hypothetical protein